MPGPASIHEFSTGVQWRAGRRGLVSSEAPSPLAFSAGEDFGGEPGWWTPETLLVAAVESSLMLSFLAEAKLKGLGIISYRSVAKGLLTREGAAPPRISELVIKPTVRVRSEADADVVRGLLGVAAAASWVCGALKLQPRFEPLIRVAAEETPSATAAAAAASKLDAYFSHEHRALDQILADVEFLVERRSFVPAGKRFGEFRLAMERHLEAEERLLPLLAQRSADGAALVAQARAEHVWIQRLVDAVGAAVSCWDFSTFSRQVTELVSALDEHQRNEEKRLHPALDEVIASEPDWQRLLAEPVVARPHESAPPA